MPKKYIIVLIGKQNSGKTTVMNHVWDLLTSYTSTDAKKKLNTNLRKEILGVVSPDIPSSKPIHRDKTVGVNSIGDDAQQVASGLIRLINEESDVIVCTARTVRMYNNAIRMIKRIPLDPKLSALGITPSQQTKAIAGLTDYEVLFYGNLYRVSGPMTTPFDPHRYIARTITEIIELL